MESGTDVHCFNVAAARQSRGAALLAHAVARSARSELLATCFGRCGVVNLLPGQWLVLGSGGHRRAALSSGRGGAGVPLGASWEEGLGLAV